MKHLLKMNESTQEDDFYFMIDPRDYLDNMKKSIEFTDVEISKLEERFSENGFPIWYRSEPYTYYSYISFESEYKRDGWAITNVTRKLPDEWYLVSRTLQSSKEESKVLFMCDQWEGLMKCIDYVCNLPLPRHFY